MRIIVKPEIMLRLMTCAAFTPNEFSGFGFVDKAGEDFEIYDFVLLDLGDRSLTEIPAKKILPLLDRPDARHMKAWIHRHPVGNGAPGKHNWSPIDEKAIRETPLGGPPEMVKWSLSLVLTPRGWVGRVDNHLKGTTAHVEVHPQDVEIYKELVGFMDHGPKFLAVKTLELFSDAMLDRYCIDRADLLDLLLEIEADTSGILQDDDDKIEFMYHEALYELGLSEEKWTTQDTSDFSGQITFL